MLLTDGEILKAADLEVYESDIVSLCGAASLPIETKLSQAVIDARVELQAYVQRASSAYGWPLSFIGGDAQAARIRDEQIVVTDALDLWLRFTALEIVFRDLVARKTGDKYERKLEQWSDRAVRARERMFNQGVGIVRAPLPRPGAPALGSATAGALAARQYWIAVTWRNAKGVESAPSLTQAVDVAVNKVATVSIAGLTPPAGATLTAGQTAITLGTATGWNVYAAAAAAGGDLLLQTPTPIPIGTASWQEPGSGLVNGAAKGKGQDPDMYVQVTNAIKRG